MKHITALGKWPDEIKDPFLVDRIIKTLEHFKQKHNHEYVFAMIQENHLGGSCRPVPVGYTPSKHSHILGIYNTDFFKELKNKLNYR